MTEPNTDNVMKTYTRQGRGYSKPHSHRKEEDANITCYKCGIKGHMARMCYRKVWCNYCKNNTHAESLDKMASEKLQRSKMATKITSSRPNM